MIELTYLLNLVINENKFKSTSQFSQLQLQNNRSYINTSKVLSHKEKSLTLDCCFNMLKISHVIFLIINPMYFKNSLYSWTFDILQSHTSIHQ